MLSKRIEIHNAIGLHARPAAMIAAEASKHRSQILLCRGSCVADAKNSIRVLALAVNSGECVELVVSGEDESYALSCLDNIFQLINSSDC